MATVKFDESWLERKERLYRSRVQAAGIMLQNEARQLISVPSRTVSYRDNRKGKRVKKLGARGNNRSRPGEPPHKDYGRLRASVQNDFKQANEEGNPTTLIGTNVPYGRYLEFGTKHMAARPWLRRTLKENRQRIVDIITRGESVSIQVGG